MLIEFSLSNFRSFKDRFTLSMEASADDWLEETNVAEIDGRRILKSAAIFGPNAGGKTNFLAAMSSFRDFVQMSSKESQSGEKIPVVPFRLHTATESAPTHFEVIFLQHGTRYRYGFEATTERVTSEWLFSQKESIRETRLFTREDSIIDASTEFKEGKGLEARTRSNALFLSVVAQFNGEISGAIMQWMEGFRDISGLDDADYMPFTAQLLKNKHYSRRIEDLTRRAVGGFEQIKTFDLTEEEVEKSLPKDLSEAIRRLIAPSPLTGISIKMVHNKFDADDRSCGLVEFNLKTDESAGTQKFLAMTGPFIHTLDAGSVLFVDELEARLHPLLTKALVSLFNGGANRKNAQLIYATHNDGLLNPAHIRRDQVWFAEKDEFGASKLFSLAEFRVRKDAKFNREYLLGQFGAVPDVRDIEKAVINVSS